MDNKIPTKNDLVRFWCKVNVRSKNKCWEWISHKDRDGYGRFYFNKKQVGAHRFSYFIKHGTIQKDLMICHTCNNPSCINPNHLYEGTAYDNVKDSKIAGTLYFSNAKGEKCPNAKLTQNQVNEIRRLLKTKMKQGDIARKFKVSQSNITLIKNGTNWKTK